MTFEILASLWRTGRESINVWDGVKEWFDDGKTKGGRASKDSGLVRLEGIIAFQGRCHRAEREDASVLDTTGERNTSSTGDSSGGMGMWLGCLL